MAAARTAEQDRKTAEAAGEAAKTRAEWAEKTEAAKMIVQADRDKQMAIIQAQKNLEVAELAKKEADELKQAMILKAEGEAKAQELMADARKKLMEADGALEKKLEAYVEANRVWATAVANIKLPSVIMSGSETSSNGLELIDILKVKLAKDLSLDPSITK